MGAVFFEFDLWKRALIIPPPQLPLRIEVRNHLFLEVQAVEEKSVLLLHQQLQETGAE